MDFSLAIANRGQALVFFDHPSCIGKPLIKASPIALFFTGRVLGLESEVASNVVSVIGMFFVQETCAECPWPAVGFEGSSKVEFAAGVLEKVFDWALEVLQKFAVDSHDLIEIRKNFIGRPAIFEAPSESLNALY